MKYLRCFGDAILINLCIIIFATVLPCFAAAAAAARSLQSCPTLCDPIDGSPPGFPVPGILQASTLEWVAISFSNACMHAKSLLTLCDPMDSSPSYMDTNAAWSSDLEVRHSFVFNELSVPYSM